MRRFKESFLPLRSTLRSSIIHNDGNDHNIVIDDEGHVAALIDFGDMAYTPLVVELAVTITYGLRW